MEFSKKNHFSILTGYLTDPENPENPENPEMRGYDPENPEISNYLLAKP